MSQNSWVRLSSSTLFSLLRCSKVSSLHLLSFKNRGLVKSAVLSECLIFLPSWWLRSWTTTCLVAFSAEQGTVGPHATNNVCQHIFMRFLAILESFYQYQCMKWMYPRSQCQPFSSKEAGLITDRVLTLQPGSFVCRVTPNQSRKFGTLKVECSMLLRMHQKKQTSNQSLNFKALNVDCSIP